MIKPLSFKRKPRPLKNNKRKMKDLFMLYEYYSLNRGKWIIKSWYTKRMMVNDMMENSNEDNKNVVHENQGLTSDAKWFLSWNI
mgnify:CR=1 FL=1